jgi:parvulin-like peptidyl-prolyl isomerase
VSDPLKSDEGYQILPVDERTAGSNTSTFNEKSARRDDSEAPPKAREDYLQSLRNEAYIKIADSYNAQVAPLLKIVPPAPR